MVHGSRVFELQINKVMSSIIQSPGRCQKPILVVHPIRKGQFGFLNCMFLIQP